MGLSLYSIPVSARRLINYPTNPRCLARATGYGRRSTIVSAGEVWTGSRRDNLLIDPKTSSLQSSYIEAEKKKKTFDLLDAVNRSRTLPIEWSELHVFVSVSRCCEKDVMGTVIQARQRKPHFEGGTMVSLACLPSTTFGVEASNLIGTGGDTDRLTASFPQLFNTEVSAIDHA